MFFKVCYSAQDAPDVQYVMHFEAEKGKVHDVARELCLQLFNTTEFINAKITKI